MLSNVLFQCIKKAALHQNGFVAGVFSFVLRAVLFHVPHLGNERLRLLTSHYVVMEILLF